jgi:predicted nucleic acid-binding protein
MKLVIDTNIIFSALLKKESKIKKFILDPANELYTCNFLFVEIFKYKEKIEKYSDLDFNDILVTMRIIFSKIHFVNEEMIPPQIYQKAYTLCSNIDEKDTPFVALALFIDTPLLTGDKKLTKGLKEKGFEKIVTLHSVLKTDSEH